MNPSAISRRQMISRMGHGLGGLAFANLLRGESAAGGGFGPLPGLPHFAPKVT